MQDAVCGRGAEKDGRDVPHKQMADHVTDSSGYKAIGITIVAPAFGTSWPGTSPRS